MDPLGLLSSGSLPIFGGAIVLGLVHGAEPGHGWPIAATYALDREPKWGHGLAASLLLGLGHLVSSLAVVAVFFLAKQAFALDRLNEPIVLGSVAIGGPVGLVAGILLVGLGIREYRRRGHGHAHGPDRDPGPAQGQPRDPDVPDHDHPHDSRHPHGPATDSWLGQLRAQLPLVGDEGHAHPTPADLDRTGLASIVWTAFVLGFVHEEEFEIIGLCLGSSVCLELMLVYAVAVLVALVGLTMLLIAGYYHYEDRMAQYAAHFPTISAVVLVAMGLGFALGLF